MVEKWQVKKFRIEESRKREGGDKTYVTMQSEYLTLFYKSYIDISIITKK